MKRVCVIGAGPAGLIASAFAADGNTVDVYDSNEKTGKKLYLTGKGRCNITNIAPRDEFLQNVPRNARFLYSCFDGFFNDDIVELVERQGVQTKVERGGRVFPQSDKSSDVIRALTSFAQKNGARFILNSRIISVDKEGSTFIIKTENGDIKHYDNVIIATGGMSYPSTGSTGDGYAFASAFGHTIIEPTASLVSLVTAEEWAGELSGLSLKNVTLSAYIDKKCVYSELGEMLFTHVGVSGPLVLSASARIADRPKGARLCIDMKPALDIETLDARIMRDMEANKHKQMKNAIVGLMPSRMVGVVLKNAGVNPDTTTDNLKKAERRSIAETLKGLTLTVVSAAPLSEAVITRGGVSTKEIEPKTMESKLVEGLYFAGEVIDVDAYTGGYNLQIAYSTGAAAGRAAAKAGVGTSDVQQPIDN